MMFRGGFLSVMSLFIFLFMLTEPVFAGINVTLESPQDNHVFGNNINVTFKCNASGDYDIVYTELYANVSGSFDKTGYHYERGIQKEEGNVLLFHFNNDSLMGENGSFIYDWSGEGNNGVPYNLVYKPSDGKLYGCFEFDYWVDFESIDRIKVEDSNTLDLTKEGAIELWFKLKNSALYGYQGLVWKGTEGVMDDAYASYKIIKYGNQINLVFGNGTHYDESIFSSATLLDNTWYHLVVTWNNVSESSINASIYINGVHDKSSVLDIIPYKSAGPLVIGREDTYISSMEGVIDEVAIYNRALTEDEISNHYNFNPILNTTVSVNWTLKNLADGSYMWACRSYDNNSNFSWSPSNNTFHVDLFTPPDMSQVSMSPSSEDDIDPDVMINVTVNVTDVSGVDSVLLQYKRAGVSTWNNVTMSNESLCEWNASFLVPSPPDTWEYRILANDTLGHTAYSQQYNLLAAYDYSWNASPLNLEETYILFDTNGSLGIITINNTGDYPLNFNITSDFANLYFNISNHNDLDMPAKGSECINLTAKSPSEPGEYDIRITVNATTINADPGERVANATLISYWGGPYLRAEIVKYESIVHQSTGGMNYSAKVRNIGNETAENLWINWTLPQGWSNTSGDLNYFAGNLSSGDNAWGNITVYVGSGANAVLSYLYMDSGSSNNSTANASVKVSVICSNSDGSCGRGCSYLTDDDCTPPSIPATPGTAVIFGASKEYGIVLEIPQRLDVNRGGMGNLRIGIRNTVKNTRLNDVYISLSGYPQTFMDISPSYLTGIGYGETGYFDVEIKAPVYVVYAEYDLNVTVRGEFTETGNVIKSEKSGKVLLVTHRIIENETMDYFKKAWEALEDMNRSGFETMEIKEMLMEMEKMMDVGNYDKVRELSEDIVSTRNLAFSFVNGVQEIESNLEEIKKFNLIMPETEKMLFLAKSAFQRGEYERAEERVKEAMMMYSIEMGGVNTWIFMYNYWWLLITLAFVSGAVIVIGRRKFVFRSITKSLQSLLEEERVIKELIEDVWKQYFERKMGFERYSEVMEGYEGGLVSLRKKRAGMLSKLAGMMKLEESIGMLKGEEEKVRSSIIEVQKKYFQMGRISRRYYDKMMEGFKTELFEIQRQMEMLKGGGDV